MTLPPLTVKVIDDLGASMQAAAERMKAMRQRIASLEEGIAALNMRLEAHEAHARALREKAKGWVENLRGEGYDTFADEVEEALR